MSSKAYAPANATDNMTETGRSLTPESRQSEVTEASFRDGLIAGALTFIPSAGAVYYGMQYSAKFRKLTNNQSRTALVVMPSLFMFGVASEMKLMNMMHDMAGEAEHASKVKDWADKHMEDRAVVYAKLTPEEREAKLSELYAKSVHGSNVRIVPGDSLGPHHVIANFWQENPFKILGVLGVPAVGYIFMKRSGKGHLALQQQIMQTRVVGQFTVLIFLLSLMGFKEYMDQSGKFITESEAERQVMEIKSARKELQFRLEEDAEKTEHNLELIHKIQEHHGK